MNYSKTRNWGMGFFITVLIAAILGVVGWIMNIVQLFNMENVLDTGVGVLKIVGIFFPPLGSVLGWIGIF